MNHHTPPAIALALLLCLSAAAQQKVAPAIELISPLPSGEQKGVIEVRVRAGVAGKSSAADPVVVLCGVGLAHARDLHRHRLRRRQTATRLCSMVFYQGGRQVVQNPIHIDVFEYPARYQAGGVFLYPTRPTGRSTPTPTPINHSSITTKSSKWA